MTVILGTNGNNNLNGTGDDDQIYARGGQDTINGGGGDDLIFIEPSPAGSDTIDGGAGADTVVLEIDFADVTVSYSAGQLVFTSQDDSTSETMVNVEQIGFTDQVVLVVGAGGYSSIQEAIDAASDGTLILVAEGTYTEQITIDGRSDITIQGVGDVTITAPADLAINGSSDYFGDQVRAVIGVTDSTNIDIKGVTVDGAFAGDTTAGSNGDELSGIAYLNSSGDVDDVTIDNVGNSQGGGLFGLQHGSGFFVDNSGLVSGNQVSVTNSTITDFQKTGALIIGADVNFSGNTVTGVGATGLTAQNGIQIALSEGTLDDNVISAIGYTVPTGGTYFYSSGIIAYEPSGPLGFDGNTITGVGAAGEFAALDLSDVNGIEVGFTNNAISDATYGIFAYSYVGGTTGLDANPDFSGTTFANIGETGIYFDPEEAVIAPFTTTTDFTVTGSDFDDLLAGSDGDDSFAGSGGNDTLGGRDGNDTLAGGNGRDGIAGGADMDQLFGGADKDTLIGAGGDDTLTGGSGRDSLRGGTGDDRFVLDSTNPADAEIVEDFASGSDEIALDSDVFGLPEGSLQPNKFVVGSNANDANDRLIYNDSNGKLFFDADGSGAGGQVLIATFEGAPTITASDFIVV
ncbi:MAG: hypothetical protein H7X93_03100 [Sphingomonadaceae bacterium]|nr:hypothetical protein [Sphingomonadaceae bacterium]